MTTLMVVDGNRGESRSVAVARRLREELAGRRLSVSEIARRLGTNQQKLSRRMTGSTPWDVDELDDVCAAAGISFAYVTTGIREIPTPNGPDDGGAVVPPPGLEPGTCGLKVHSSTTELRGRAQDTAPAYLPSEVPVAA